MAMPSAEAVTKLLQSIPEYASAFERAFSDDPNPVTFDNAARAIGAFERTLLTPGRWDRYLNGDPGALAPKESAGFAVFVRSGCSQCHMGPLVGGAGFAKLGLVQPWPNQTDLGRFAVTGEQRDRFVFKVPSLRNVGKTAPYFHDGEVNELEDAVRNMAAHQLGVELPASEVELIVAWLEALTGELPREGIRAPSPPADNGKAPAP
jgi:cytochrome c peroxidase